MAIFMIRFGCMLFPLNGFFINCMALVVLGGNVPFSILFLTKIPIEPKLFSSTYLFWDSLPPITPSKDVIIFHFIVTLFHEMLPSRNIYPSSNVQVTNND